MTLKYFNNCKDLVECKSKYRQLAKELHPDVSKDKEGIKFKEMKNEYDSIIKNPTLLIKKESFNYSGQKTYWESDTRYEKEWVKEKEFSKYKKQTISLKDKIDDLLKIQKEKLYKPFWVYVKFIDYCKEEKKDPSLKSFEYIAKALDYKLSWAKIQYEKYYQ